MPVLNSLRSTISTTGRRAWLPTKGDQKPILRLSRQGAKGAILGLSDCAPGRVGPGSAACHRSLRLNSMTGAILFQGSLRLVEHIRGNDLAPDSTLDLGEDLSPFSIHLRQTFCT